MKQASTTTGGRVLVLPFLLLHLLHPGLPQATHEGKLSPRAAFTQRPPPLPPPPRPPQAIIHTRENSNNNSSSSSNSYNNSSSSLSPEPNSYNNNTITSLSFTSHHDPADDLETHTLLAADSSTRVRRSAGHTTKQSQRRNLNNSRSKRGRSRKRTLKKKSRRSGSSRRSSRGGATHTPAAVTTRTKTPRTRSLERSNRDREPVEESTLIHVAAHRDSTVTSHVASPSGHTSTRYRSPTGPGESPYHTSSAAAAAGDVHTSTGLQQPGFRHYQQFHHQDSELAGQQGDTAGWEGTEASRGGPGVTRVGHHGVWDEEDEWRHVHRGGSRRDEWRHVRRGGSRRDHHQEQQYFLDQQSSSPRFSIPETIVKDGKVFYRYDAGGTVDREEEGSRAHRGHSGSEGREDDSQSQSKRSHSSHPSPYGGQNRADIPVDLRDYLNSGTGIPNSYVSAQAHTIASQDGGLSHAVVTGSMPGATGMATAGHGSRRAEAWVHTGPHAVSRAQVSSPPGSPQLTAEVNSVPDGSTADASADGPAGGISHTQMDFSNDTHNHPTHGLATAIVTPEGGSTLASLGGEAGQGSYFGSAISASSPQSHQQANLTPISETHTAVDGSPQTHAGEETFDVHDEGQPVVELSHDMLGSIMEVVHQPQMVPEVVDLPPPPPFAMDRDVVMGGSGTPPLESEVEQVPQSSMEEGGEVRKEGVREGQVGEVTYFKGELGPSPESDDLLPQSQHYSHYDYYGGIPTDGMQYYDTSNPDAPHTPYFEMGPEIFPVGPLQPDSPLPLSTSAPDLYTDYTFSTSSPPHTTPHTPTLVHQVHTATAHLPGDLQTHHVTSDPLWLHQSTPVLPQSTPAPPQSTPVLPQSTPAPPQSTPALPQSTPAPPQSTPAPPQSTPASPQPVSTVPQSSQPTPRLSYPHLPSSGHYYPDYIHPDPSGDIWPSTGNTTDQLQISPSLNVTAIDAHSDVSTHRGTVDEAAREAEELWRESEVGAGRDYGSGEGRRFGDGDWRDSGDGGLGRGALSAVGSEADRGGVAIVPGAVGTTHTLPNGEDGPTLNVMTVAAVRGMVAQRTGAPIPPGGKIPGAPGYRVPEGFRGHVVLGHNLPVETGSRRVLPGFNTQVRLDPEGGMSGPVFASVSAPPNPRHQPGGTTGVHVTLASRGGSTRPRTTSGSRGNYWSGVGGRPQTQSSQNTMTRSTSARQPTWDGRASSRQSWQTGASPRKSWDGDRSQSQGRCVPYTRVICKVIICC